MSMDSTRLRRFARTFSSWPEYACTTYQRASLAETAALLTAMFILPRRLRRHGWSRGRCDGWYGGCQRGGAWRRGGSGRGGLGRDRLLHPKAEQVVRADRKSTRLNSSHLG